MDDTKQYGLNDPLFEEVKHLVISHNNASIAFVQRQTLMGYGRAKALIEAMEGKYLSPPKTNGIRQVIV